MKSGSCPKCSSANVHSVTQTAVEVAIAITWSRTASVEYLVCTGCGYVELYVKDKSMLPSIAEKYPKIG